MNTIFRQAYIDKILKYVGMETIIALTGQRRVGKSCMLRQFFTLKSSESGNNVIFIDKEKREFDAIKDYLDLNEYLESKIDKDRHNYILIDEIQDIKEFERSIRSFRTEPHTDIIITGSNARMLSSELTTIIGGRYKEIYIQPLSYTEFLEFHELNNNDLSLSMYLSYGGLPGLKRIGLEESDVREYQADIFNTVLLKDVIQRNSIRNITFLNNLVTFIADNTGKLISANNISKFMKSQNDSVTTALILNYLRYLSEAYIIHKVNRYDIHGKKLFECNDKYYFEDIGIRNALAGGTRDGDIEKVIESLVYQQLLRLGWNVTVGQLQVGEIDFVCTKAGGERIYIQVAYLIIDEHTRKREFGNLKEIKDNYPKYVISMTPMVNRTIDEGIVHLGLRQFLSNGL